MSLNINENCHYWLRTPWESTQVSFDTTASGCGVIYVTAGEHSSTNRLYYNYANDSYLSYSDMGIRPAFYLDESNAVILSGSGTEDDPYVVEGKKEDRISVFCNGWELEFDQPPVLENDRVLVPLRAIFEALGAKVSWEESTQTVTAEKDGLAIALQIGSNVMTKNGENIELDISPRLIGGRTLVPVRVVSEGVGANVEWDWETQTVTITVN